MAALDHNVAVALTDPEDASTIHFPIAGLGKNRDLAHELLGPPHFALEEDGMLMAIEHWAFQFPCGLRILYSFDPYQGGGGVFADMPEIDHVIRHLSLPRDCQEPQTVEDLQPYIDAVMSRPDRRVQQLRNLRSHQAWRQGDDGNAIKVGQPTTKRDANCRASELESHGHKQIYWVSAVK